MNISDILISLALAILMLGLGFGIQKEHILEHLKNPRILLLGLFCQISLPLLFVISLISWFSIEGPAAIGFLLTASVPGGVTSALITKWAKGDVALSLALTSISSMVVPVFTLPVVLLWGLDYYDLTDGAEINRWQLLLKLSILTILPILAGLILKSKINCGQIGKVERFFHRYSIGYYGIVLIAGVGLVFSQNEGLPDHFTDFVSLSCIMIISLMLIVYIPCRLFRLNRKVSLTLGIETSFQNNSLALAIILTTISDSNAAIPPMIYGLTMTIIGLLTVAISRNV